MKKQAVIILVLCLCLAGLGGGLFLLREKPEETAAPETMRDDSILAFSGEELSLIRVENGEGGFSASKTEDGWVIDGLDRIPLDSSLLHTLVSSVTSLKSVQEIEDGGGRLEEFGLTEDSASAAVEAGGQEDKTVRILVGDEVPGTDKRSRYVERDGRVYVAYDTKVGVFLNSALDFVEKEITPEAGSTENYTVEKAELTGSRFADLPGAGDQQAVTVELSEDTELAGVPFRMYEVSSPWHMAADTSVMETWLKSFFGFSAGKTMAVQPSAEEEDSFGLKTPWMSVVLLYKDGSGTEQTAAFAVSEPDPSGKAFAGVPGRDVIYQVDLSDRDWALRAPEELLSRQIFAPSVLSLSSITLEDASGETVITLEQDEENRSTAAFLEDTELEDKSFRNFYYTLISQTAEEVILEQKPRPEGSAQEAEIVFSYTEEGKEPDVVTYYRESDRMLYVEVNGGERAYRMPDARYQQVREALKKLAAGEEVEARY